MSRVLVVDDDGGMRAALEARFIRRGWGVDTAASAREAMEKFRRSMHPLIVTDIRMPGEDGFFIMREAQAMTAQTAIILLTAYANIPDAVTAMKNGACDYLVKPVSFEQLEHAAERILSACRNDADQTKELVGQAPCWLRALQRARQAAATDADVLIEAESGTGKELVARLIHRLSPRRNRPFVAVNCAAFPETLLESELFGYSKGAFTGATNAKPGKFELAHGGTLLLDEVGEMPLSLQPKLLRALQEREFDRLGDTRPVRVDLRVIATTNCALAKMVREGKFRADLYYRLNVIPLSLPPLRERAGDVSELAQHFARLYSPAGRLLHLHPELLARLEGHCWPGNVRELANCMRRAVALSTGAELGTSTLEGAEWDSAAIVSQENLSCLRAGLSLGEMERKLVEITLQATGGNRSRAAELLGVSLRTVRNKVRSYGLPSWSSYASAQVDQRKVGKLALAIQVAFQELGVFPVSNTKIPIDMNEPMPFSTVQAVENAKRNTEVGRVSSPPLDVLSAASREANLSALQSELQQALQKEIAMHSVALHRESEGLVISLREFGFFNSGSASLRPSAMPALDRIASILSIRICRLRIEGHTDNVPIHTAQMASNWELSTARSTELARLLIVRYSFAPQRLSAAGYAEYHPIASNQTAQGRAQNRRVDLVILSEHVLRGDTALETSSSKPSAGVPVISSSR